MLVTPPFFLQLAFAYAASVAPSTSLAFAWYESALNPNTIHDNTTGLTHRPDTAPAAIALAAALLAHRHSLDLGIMQVNSANLARTGLTVSTAFDPGQSIRAGAQIHVAFVYGNHGEGVPVEDLSAGQREVVLRKTLLEYLRARIEYVYQLQQRDYTTVSALSEPKLREVYQSAWWNGKTPGHPHLVYGNSPTAGYALVTQAAIHRDPNASNAASATFTLHRVLPNAAPQDVKMRADFAWGDAAPGDIPIPILEQYDPLSIEFTAFEAYPD